MQDTIIEKCALFMSVNRANIRIVSESSGELSCFYKISEPKFIGEEARRNANKILDKYTAVKNENIIVFKDRLKMSYIISIIKVEKKDRLLISIGPFLDEEIKSEDIKFLGHSMKLSSENILILQNFYSKLPVFGNEEISGTAQVLNTVLKSTAKQPQIINDVTRTRLPRENQYSNKFEQYDFVERNYKAEAIVLKAIETGNVEQIDEILNLRYNQINIPSRIKYDPLRDIKNLTLTMNSISTRAAIKGGLNVHLAHSISTKYAIAIESQTSVESTMRLVIELTKEYARCVRDYSLKKYPPLIKEALIIIRKNITSAVSLKTIAAELHTSSEHLSREFKKEIGKNITDYINELKIHESLDLVKSKKYSISDIAFIFGYSSSSYYSTVFKKVMGVSPNQI